MSIPNYQNLFEKIAKQENVQHERRSFGNEYLLKLKPGNTYTFRLLWLPPADGCNREYPMINQYIHRHWDNSATSKRLSQVYCPTSQYLMGDGANAWNACPICQKCGNFYKQYEKENSQSAYDMWKAYHRTLVGYIPVYVVSSSDETATGVRILTYGKMMKDFFDRKIFGKVNNKKTNNDDEATIISEDEIVGLDALMYLKDNDVETLGCNFIVSVSTKKMPINGKQVDMPQYNMDFSRKPTKISNFIINETEVPVTPEYIINLSKDINFDADYYKESSPAELQDFYNKYVSLNDEQDEDIIPIKQTSSKTLDITNTTPILDEDLNIENNIENNDKDDTSAGSDDIDVDALISGL